MKDVFLRDQPCSHPNGEGPQRLQKILGPVPTYLLTDQIRYGNVWETGVFQKDQA